MTREEQQTDQYEQALRAEFHKAILAADRAEDVLQLPTITLSQGLQNLANARGYVAGLCRAIELMDEARASA